MATLFAYTLFLWVELIGFDNTKPDFGVGDYLAKMPRKPDAISLLLENDRLFRSHVGLEEDFSLPPFCCSYGNRPYNVDRRRQDWTAFQLRGLVAELNRCGIETYASFFNRTGALPTVEAEIYEVSGRLPSFLVDFGFRGFHFSDGWAPPRYLLPSCADEDRARIARESAQRYASNIGTMMKALKERGLKGWANTCWTLDPYEALYRYGVDYRLLAKTGLDGFVVESSASALELEGRNYHADRSRIDISAAMLLRLRAMVPEMPFVLLHAINDGNEQWSALRHGPTISKSEAISLGTQYYEGRRILDGYLACLADGIREAEWQELFGGWNLGMHDFEGPVGASVVWSDRAFDAEFDACTASHDASSQTLLAGLLSRGMVLNESVSVAYAMANADKPVVVLNPAFFPKDEIAALRCRRGNVFEFGKGATAPFNAPYVERTDKRPFPGMPETDSCYFTRPLSENVPQPIQYDMLADRVNWMSSPYGVLTKGLRSWAVRMRDGRLGIFLRNDGDAYLTAEISPKEGVSDVKVHTLFPSLPVSTVLKLRLAPRETSLISIHESLHSLPKLL